MGYSHAVRFSGELVIISGQVPLDAQGNLVGKNDPEEQIRQVSGIWSVRWKVRAPGSPTSSSSQFFSPMSPMLAPSGGAR